MSAEGERLEISRPVSTDAHEAESSRTRQLGNLRTRRGRGRKLEADARQQYRTKFVNSVYEMQIVAMKHNTQSIIDHAINDQ